MKLLFMRRIRWTLQEGVCVQVLRFHAALHLACEVPLMPENLSHGTKRQLFREEARKGSRTHVRQFVWYLRTSRSLVPLSLCFRLHLGGLWVVVLTTTLTWSFCPSATVTNSTASGPMRLPSSHEQSCRIIHLLPLFPGSAPLQPTRTEAVFRIAPGWPSVGPTAG